METLISFLLDRTGSMISVREDVIGGFNAFLEEQRKIPGKCRFLLTQFDSMSVDTVDYDDIRDVPDLNHDTYVPRANTPLLDAIAQTMGRIDDLNVEPDRVLFVIYTDGFENASREHTRESVKKLIADAQENYGWDFIFMGADIDAYTQASAIGLLAGQTVAVASSQTSQTMGAVSQTVSEYRSGGPYSDAMKNLKDEEARQKT